MGRFLGYMAAITMAGPLLGQTQVDQAAMTITEQDVARHVGVLADDSMIGRSTPSRELDLAAQYVADHFKKLGLAPGGDSSTWFQRYPAGRGTAPNTVGILEGGDPVLKQEYIVITAHMDHIGAGWNKAMEQMRGIPRPPNDSIYNGADDNASGTAGILELAEAFTRPGARPRRSLIFAAVSGEEGGRRGSKHFVAHPPVPFAQLVANVNFDMVGRGPEGEVLVIGLEHSDLGEIFRRVNAAHADLRLAPVPNPPAARLRSSDHYSFARRGIPVLKFGGPTHADWHGLGDSPDKIQTEREVRVLRLAFHVIREAANTDRRPQWNKESYDAIVDGGS